MLLQQSQLENFHQQNSSQVRRPNFRPLLSVVNEPASFDSVAFSLMAFEVCIGSQGASQGEIV